MRYEVTFNSNAEFYGAIYMPRADLIFSSNIQLYGSAIGNAILLNANACVTYEEELGDLEGTPSAGEGGSGFFVKSWQQKH